MSFKKTQDLLEELAEEYRELVTGWRQLWLNAGAAGKRQILVDTVTGAGYTSRPLGHLIYATDKAAPLGGIHTEFRTNLRTPSSAVVLRINWADQPGLILGNHQLSATWRDDRVVGFHLSHFYDQEVDRITKDGVFGGTGSRIAPCRPLLTVLRQYQRGLAATRTLMDEISRDVLGISES